MSATTLDEFVTRINELPQAERAELMRRLNESGTAASDPNGSNENAIQDRGVRNGNGDPNLKWIKENKDKYAGNYVALKDGQLIAYGRTIREADMAAKASGVKDPLLHYILAQGEEAWGGW